MPKTSSSPATSASRATSSPATATGDVDHAHDRRTNVGDLLAFCDAGAYGFSMASHYNARLLPAEVLVDGDDVRVIRERQTFEDLVRGMR